MNFGMVLLQSGPNQEQIQQAILAMMTILPFIILIGMAVIMVPFWFICKKAGLSPWLSLLNFIPLGNLVLIYILAFSQWRVVPVAAQWPVQPPYPPTMPPQV